jgi:hypothetical protein
MLVKFNKRGRGGGASATEYLTGDFGTIKMDNGKPRMPTKAEQDQDIGLRKIKPVVLRGDVEQVKQLINGLSFAQNYTSGTLSFAENNMPDHQKNKIMNEFQEMLLAGLEPDQYDILWVEHLDKDRLELNFLIPNVELGTGKRLQPYYDFIDRDRVNAWQQITNDENSFADPHDPARKQELNTAHDLPKDKKFAATMITNTLLKSIASGAISNRDDIIKSLESRGFEVVKRKKPSLKSISIKNPDGGRNIRLKGEIYEQTFRSSNGIRDTIERTNREYKENSEQRVTAARKTLEIRSEEKCKYNKSRYLRAEQAEPTSNTASISKIIADISLRNDIRSSIDSNRAIHTTKIKNNDINDIDEEVKDNVRHKSSISTVIETLVRAVRVAVRRSNRASESISRADNFAHRNKINQFKQRQLKQVKRNVNSRTTTLSM